MMSAQQKSDVAKKLDKVVFLDRDGVINLDSSDYIKSWSEFKFIPRSIEAIKELTLKGFNAIVITNQSVINRNMVSDKGLEYILTMMKNEVRSGGGLINDIFICPHIPEDNCDCRKPRPGLIFQAQKAYSIDLKDAVMVGDSVKDIECARNAGCGVKLSWSKPEMEPKLKRLWRKRKFTLTTSLRIFTKLFNGLSKATKVNE